MKNYLFCSHWLGFCRYDENGDGVLDLTEFTALVRAVDKIADETKILRMYSNALDLTGEGDRISKVVISPD